jgi:hypothetical protein
MFDKRWSYWARTIEAGKPLDEAIPKIDFDSRPNPETAKNITDCIQYMQSKGYSSEAWMSFIEWLLWGFGTTIQPEFPSKVTEDVSWYWYKTFNLGLMMKHPCDHMAWGSCEINDMTKSHKGFFPTPGSVVKMMVEMQMTNADKTSTVCDPCLGTGIMLLYASNYSLRLYGQDISADMCKMATVNAWIYIPWLAYQADVRIDWNTKDDYENTIIRLEEWKKGINLKTSMLTYRQKSNTLLQFL